MRTDVGKAIYTILSTTSGVTSLVSTKIYPVRAPQQTAAPFVVYSIVSVNPADTKDRPTNVDTVRLQIDVYARTYAQAESVHAAVRTAIDAYTIGATVSGVKLDGIKYETENDAFEDDIDIHKKSSDYMVRVKY